MTRVGEPAVFDAEHHGRPRIVECLPFELAGDLCQRHRELAGSVGLPSLQYMAGRDFEPQVIQTSYRSRRSPVGATSAVGA